MGIHKGTRLTDTPKDKALRIRYDSDTEQKLNAICEATGKTRSQVVREGIDKLYSELKQK